MKKIFITSLVAALLAGCASQSVDVSKSEYAEVPVLQEYPEEKGVTKLRQQEDVVTVADGKVKDRLVCEYIKPTGSHMTKRYCRTREEMEKAEKEANETMLHLPNPGRPGDFITHKP